jgi:hypothetical protein
VVTPEILRKAQVLIGQGLKVREAAACRKVSKSALYGALAEYEANSDREARCSTQERSGGAGQ